MAKKKRVVIGNQYVARTRRFDGKLFTLESIGFMTKKTCQLLAKVYKDSGFLTRVVQISSGRYVLYVRRR